MDKQDLTETKARYLQYVGVQFRDDDKNLREGDIFKDGVIMRFKNGYLDGGDLPAIETEDGHIERWTQGQLTDIATDWLSHREKWENGKRIS